MGVFGLRWLKSVCWKKFMVVPFGGPPPSLEGGVWSDAFCLLVSCLSLVLLVSSLLPISCLWCLWLTHAHIRDDCSPTLAGFAHVFNAAASTRPVAHRLSRQWKKVYVLFEKFRSPNLSRSATERALSWLLAPQWFPLCFVLPMLVF